MGRQAHLARLALGRSPFGQPIRDEGGEVFIGPHTHDNDARDYIQQFNEKGHPTLENSKLADHQLRRAQNEVYRAAGVLQAKEDIKPKSHWQRLTHRERLERIIEENAFAVSRRSIPDDFALHLSTWWICALRNRLLTYKLYSESPIIRIVQTEIHLQGLQTFFGSGLSTILTSTILTRARTRIFSSTLDRLDLAEPRIKHQYAESSIQLAIQYALDFGVFCFIQWPLQAFSILKSLHLIPSTAESSLTAVIPWYQQSIGWFPKPPPTLNLGLTISYAGACLVTPVVLAYLKDLFTETIYTGITATIRTLAPKPEEPDDRCKTACFDEGIFSRAMPGFGQNVPAKRKYYGPRTVFGCFERAFPTMCSLLVHLTGLQLESETRLSPWNESALYEACKERYKNYLCNNINRPRSRQVADRAIRHAVVQEVLEEHNIDIRGERISITAWADDLAWEDDLGGSRAAYSPSTATPAPSDLFAVTDWQTSTSVPPTTQDQTQRSVTSEIGHRPPPSLSEHSDALPSTPAADGEQAIRSTHADLADAGNESLNTERELLEVIIRTRPSPEAENVVLDASSMTLERLLEPVDLQEPPRPMGAPATPVPGIERAPPLTRTTLRPIRRPTEVDDRLEAITDRINTVEYLKKCLDEPKDAVKHRVTLLSNWPVDMLALYGSSIITSIIMMPMDMLLHRLVASTFLASETAAGRSPLEETSFTGAIWPVSLRLFPNISLRSGMILTGNLFATFAMQGLVSTIMWNVNARMMMYVGQRYYGWGKF